MSQKIQAFIFDLDGVIVDTAKFHFLAWQRLAAKLGIDFTEEDNEMLKGVGRMDSLEKILWLGKMQLARHQMETLTEKKNEWYKEYVDKLQRGDELPGALEFLESARSLNLKLAVGSSSSNARRVLQQMDMVECFDVIIDGNDITRSKPDPQVFLLGCAGLEIEPAYTVVFEDAQSDIEAARLAGAYTVGIGSAHCLSTADLVISGLSAMNPDQVIKELVSTQIMQ